MARSRRTARAEARRRHREQQRAVETTGPAVEPAETKRPSLVENLGLNFKLPDVGADLRALPSIARHSWALSAPLAAVIVAFFIALDPAVYQLQGTNSDPMTVVAERLVFQFVLLPPPVTPVFLAGVLAPRASWLVGAIVGVVSTSAFLALLSIHGPSTYFNYPFSATLAGQTLITYLPIYVLLGGFSGWYRRWLVGRQQRTRQLAEERRRAKARDERRGRTAAARR